MARRSKPSKLEKAEEDLKQAQAAGYKRGQHVEKDKQRKVVKCNTRTKRKQNVFLEQYLMWHLIHWREECAAQGIQPLPEEEEANQRFLGPETPAPDIATIKDFMRYYAARSSRRGMIVSQLAVDGLLARAEFLFAGFFRRTGTEVPEEDRKAIYAWIKYVLTTERLPNGEPILVNVHRIKYNFHRRDIDRVLFTIWTHDDRIFIPERYRIQYTFLFWLYCWTGARIHAFFEDGLRWKDVELVLKRQPGQHWRVIYLIKQRHVKNNRSPKHNWFGAAGKDDRRLIYNGAAFLLAMAIADGVLFGIPSLDRLWEMDFPPGEDELPLKYVNGTENLPILRSCTQARGVQEKPMGEQAFLRIHRNNMHNAGYIFGGSIHAIRRALGAAVGSELPHLIQPLFSPCAGPDSAEDTDSILEIYDPAERAQFVTQADTRIWGQSYVANVPAVDGQGAILEEQTESLHIDYFRSLQQFRRSGLPVELPAAIQHQLRQDDPGLRQCLLRVQCLEATPDQAIELKQARSELQSYRNHLYKKKLDEYQRQWVDHVDRQAILNPGQARPAGPSRTEMTQHMHLFLPERERLAHVMVTKAELSPEELKGVMKDLISLCTRDQTVLYLPSAEPIKGKCPVETCSKDLSCGLLGVLTGGAIVQTICSPLKSYQFAKELWTHIDDKHLAPHQPATSCLHPLCNDAPSVTALELRYHLIDVHRLPPHFPGDSFEDDVDESEAGSDDLDEERAARACTKRPQAFTACRGFKSYTSPETVGRKRPASPATINPLMLHDRTEGDTLRDAHRPAKRLKSSSSSRPSPHSSPESLLPITPPAPMDAYFGREWCGPFLAEVAGEPKNLQSISSHSDDKLFRDFTCLHDEVIGKPSPSTPPLAKNSQHAVSVISKPKLILHPPKPRLLIRLRSSRPPDSGIEAATGSASNKAPRLIIRKPRKGSPRTVNGSPSKRQNDKTPGKAINSGGLIIFSKRKGIRTRRL